MMRGVIRLTALGEDNNGILPRTIPPETDCFNILYGFMICLSLNLLRPLILAFVGETIEDLRLAERLWIYHESRRS
jgi:hypothetical protein